MRFRAGIFVLQIIFFLLLCGGAAAKVNLARYGVTGIPDSVKVPWTAADSFASLMKHHPQLSSGNVISGIEHTRVMQDKTIDFYLLLLACVSLGLIRMMDTRYFHNLWRAFLNPTLSARLFKEKLESTPLPNLLMNIFFTVVAGSYIYYVVRLIIPQRTGNFAPSLLIVMLIAGMMAIYLVKYGLVRFSGWAFKVQGITEHYIFNVFLINKVLSVILLPFVIMLAFGDRNLAEPTIIVSLIVTILLLINRYTRSWKVFGSFFQYSKFHFFTYLCASELLPLAVLMKLLVRGLLY